MKAVFNLAFFVTLLLNCLNASVMRQESFRDHFGRLLDISDPNDHRATAEAFWAALVKQADYSGYGTFIPKSWRPKSTAVRTLKALRGNPLGTATAIVSGNNRSNAEIQRSLLIGAGLKFGDLCITKPWAAVALLASFYALFKLLVLIGQSGSALLYPVRFSVKFAIRIQHNIFKNLLELAHAIMPQMFDFVRSQVKFLK